MRPSSLTAATVWSCASPDGNTACWPRATWGELTFQGTRYLGFDRRGTAEPASEEPPIRSTEKKSWDPEL